MRLMIRLAFLVLLPVVTSGWASLFSSSSSAASSSAEVGVDGELSSMGDESAAATEAEAVAAAAAAAAAESAAAAPPPPPRDDGRLTVRFVNEAKIDLDLFWDDGSYGVIVASKVAPNGGEVSMDTTVGHKLYWTVHGRRQQVGGDQVMTAGRTTYVLPASTPVAVQKSNCQDRSRRCKIDAANGECTRNPGWMIVNCPVSCGQCELLDPKKRCSREAAHLNMSTEPSWERGSLDALFTDIVTNPVWAAFKPTAASQPPDGPWVVTFDNVVKDEEIEALLASVAADFERSTDTGASNEFGEAQKLVSTGRTSENAWCINNCYAHPLVMRLTERIENITRVPQGNYENFQVLRYKPGQFYRTHHDMSEGDNQLACGPRILTFFLYLSDVEEGGGTNFPRLDLTVQPKRGSAVLWPSVLDADPKRQDPRTHHQALPVEKGTKFAANAWIHLYDYKMPNLWGCTGAFG